MHRSSRNRGFSHIIQFWLLLRQLRRKKSVESAPQPQIPKQMHASYSNQARTASGRNQAETVDLELYWVNGSVKVVFTHPPISHPVSQSSTLYSSTRFVPKTKFPVLQALNRNLGHRGTAVSYAGLGRPSCTSAPEGHG